MASAKERKINSERVLKSLGLAIPPELPVLSLDRSTKLREPQVVARRALCMYGVALAEDSEYRPMVRDWLASEDLWDYVTRDEGSFLTSPNPTKQQMNRASCVQRACTSYFGLWVKFKNLGRHANPIQKSQGLICRNSVAQRAILSMGGSFGVDQLYLMNLMSHTELGGLLFRREISLRQKERMSYPLKKLTKLLLAKDSGLSAG